MRKSYAELRLCKKKLEYALTKPLDSYNISNIRGFYKHIHTHWFKIVGSKWEFEERLHAYKFTAPSKLEMMLYYEYLFHAEKILKTCKENMTSVGIDI